MRTALSGEERQRASCAAVRDSFETENVEARSSCAPLVPCSRFSGAGFSVASAIERFSNQAFKAARAHPKLVRLGFLAFILLSVMYPHQAKGGVLDTFATSLAGPAAIYMQKGLSLGFDIAMAFFAVSAIIKATTTYFTERTIPAVARQLLSFALQAGIPLVVVGMLSGNIGSVGPISVFNLAQQIGTLVGIPGAGVTPSGIMQNGVGTANHVFGAGLQQLVAAMTPTMPTGNIWQIIGSAATEAIGFMITAVFSGMIVFTLAMVWVVIFFLYGGLAVELMLVTIETYITISLGSWTLGLSTSPLSGLAGNYWGAVIGAIVRFITIFALNAVGGTLATTFVTYANSAHFNTLPTSLAGLGAYVSGGILTYISILTSAWVLGKVFSEVAKLSDAIMSGKSALGGAGHQAVVGTAMAAAEKVGGAAMAMATGGASAAALGAMVGAKGVASAKLIGMMRAGGGGGDRSKKG